MFNYPRNGSLVSGGGERIICALHIYWPSTLVAVSLFLFFSPYFFVSHVAEKLGAVRALTLRVQKQKRTYARLLTFRRLMSTIVDVPHR